MKIVLYIIRKSKLFVLTFLILCVGSMKLLAQNKLHSSVHLPKFDKVEIRDVFNTLKQQQSVLFSYNSNLLDLDKQVSIESFDGILIDYLERLLGDKYSFKEISSHIIITYAPQRMDVSMVDIDTIKNNRTRISGYVKDIRTNKPLRLATVYDQATFQASTITNKNGYFELDLKKPENTFRIALSKEYYRDTMLVLLLPVEISISHKERKTGYYQVIDSSKTISNSFFGRTFTSSRQRVQNLNIGGFFVQSPFQISMTPGLSTHGLLNSQVVNKFSLNIIGGYTAGVTGTEFAGVFNINQFHMHGFQMAGLTNVVGGNVKGVQAAGVGNVGLNKLSGVQFSGVWNSIDTVSAGMQITGVMNLANNAHRTIQFAGGINISKNEVGSQVAGVINIAKKVGGIQFGVVNIADNSDYPIGVFNWIKNGRKQLSLGIDNTQYTSLSFRTGGRVLYSLLGIGTYWNEANYKYGMEFGIGAHLLQRNSFTLSTELVQRTNFTDKLHIIDANQVSIRVVPAVSIYKNIQIYAAPSLIFTDGINQGTNNSKFVWKLWKADPSKSTFHGGGTVGLTYIF